MNLEPKIIELLNQRGIRTESEREEFFSEKPQTTHNPFLLHNMQEGVDFLLSAIEEEKNICIYGDYDADGITSTVILTEVLSHLTDHLMYYIPSRFDEGYGLNKDAIDAILSMGGECIVTVDCGSVSVDEVAYAKEKGLSIMVTDHHTVTDTIADCIVINPAQPDCHYPCPYLAGCGVAFKLAQAIVSTVGLPKNVLTSVLDMVGIGTIGDIVPLVGENRTLAKYGLRAINTSRRKTLAELIDQIGLKRGQITAENVSFGIVPHLNAAGRMHHASIAVETFLSKDPEVISKNINRMIACNVERKKTQESTFRECEKLVQTTYQGDSFLVLELPDAHEGITGIVAGKIKDTFYKPTILVTPTQDGCLKGTGRCIEGINLYEQLHQNAPLFERFGGHKAACGFTIRKENLPRLRENLIRQMDELQEKEPDLFLKRVYPDLELEPEDLNFSLVAQLKLFEPCGNGNPRPLVSLEGRPADIGRMGSQGQYLRFQHVMSEGKSLKCAVFRDTDRIEQVLLSAGGVAHVIGNLKENTFRQKTSLEMIVEEITGSGNDR